MLTPGESLTTPKSVNKASCLKDLRAKKQVSVSPARTTYVDKTKWVIILSSRSLSDAEVSLLKKGLNFAVTPANIPAAEIIANVESAVMYGTNRHRQKSLQQRRNNATPSRAIKRTS